MVYATNDLTGTQAGAFRKFIKESKAPLQFVYDEGVPTNTSSYTVIINNIKAANPDAVIELGYAGNDIAFLRNLQDSDVKFKWLFAIYPGLETDLLKKAVGAKALDYVYTHVPSSVISYAYAPNFGMSLAQFRATWFEKYAHSHVEFGFNSLSGKLRTLDGLFQLDPTGAQIGEVTPLGQIVPATAGDIKFVIVYPRGVATGKPV